MQATIRPVAIIVDSMQRYILRVPDRKHPHTWHSSNIWHLYEGYMYRNTSPRDCMLLELARNVSCRWRVQMDYKRDEDIPVEYEYPPVVSSGSVWHPYLIKDSWWLWPKDDCIVIQAHHMREAVEDDAYYPRFLPGIADVFRQHFRHIDNK